MSAGAGAWPAAGLDRIARLHVLSAGLPGTVVAETVFDAPMDSVWPRLTDFENAVARFDHDVAWIRVVERRRDPAGPGERLRLRSRQTARVLWLPTSLDVDLAPGWCWMVTRPHLYVIGMAAEPDGPDGRRTRFAHLEGVAAAPPGPLRHLLRPVYALSRWRHRRHIPHDIAGMHRYLAATNTDTDGTAEPDTGVDPDG